MWSGCGANMVLPHTTKYRHRHHHHYLAGSAAKFKVVSLGGPAWRGWRVSSVAGKCVGGGLGGGKDWKEV
ncbi:hypothetical protein E2C01_044839 [Portunus trituberculatus]|uniref:Uncharacterized protein n=1 Tax=Portunus trituberculatus TaxID=210409 RepID=A0A5B7FWM8_PORTR|nr:hypothetical protein [Portunus trituberculatus]